MMILAAAALASATLPDGNGTARTPHIGARASGQAIVRLMEGEVVRLDSDGIASNVRARVTMIRLEDGDHRANIVEFE